MRLVEVTEVTENLKLETLVTVVICEELEFQKHTFESSVSEVFQN